MKKRLFLILSVAVMLAAGCGNTDRILPDVGTDTTQTVTDAAEPDMAGDKKTPAADQAQNGDTGKEQTAEEMAKEPGQEKGDKGAVETPEPKPVSQPERQEETEPAQSSTDVQKQEDTKTECEAKPEETKPEETKQQEQTVTALPYDPVSVYAKELMEQIREVVEKISCQEKRYDALNEKLKEIGTAGQDAQIQSNLLSQLSEKDKMLEKQQNELNEARVQIAKLHGELEAVRKERKALEEQVKNAVRTEPEAVAEAKKPEKEKKPETKAESSVPGMPESALYPGIEYHAAVVDRDGNIIRFVPVERMERKDRGSVMGSMFSRFFLKKKTDIVKLLAEKDLSPEQLVQVRSAIEKGLSEKQLLVLINNKIPAGQMEEIINIAVYDGSLTMVVGVEVSFLSPEEQALVFEVMEKNCIKLKKDAAGRLRAAAGTITEESVQSILGLDKPVAEVKRPVSVKLPAKVYHRYFANVAAKDVQGILEEALDLYFERKGA